MLIETRIKKPVCVLCLGIRGGLILAVMAARLVDVKDAPRRISSSEERTLIIILTIKKLITNFVLMIRK